MAATAINNGFSAFFGFNADRFGVGLGGFLNSGRRGPKVIDVEFERVGRRPVHSAPIDTSRFDASGLDQIATITPSAVAAPERLHQLYRPTMKKAGAAALVSPPSDPGQVIDTFA